LVPELHIEHFIPQTYLWHTACRRDMKRYDNVTEFQFKLFKLQICINFTYSLIHLHPNRIYSVSPLQRAVVQWCHCWLLWESYGMHDYLLWARCIVSTV